jgi:hypothetical protein
VKGQNLYQVSDVVYEILNRIEKGTKLKLNSIFGSPAERDFYFRLKGKFSHVYPQQALTVFIDPAKVRHLFTKPWHERYFFRARVDILICTFKGNPLFAAEYQGQGYHDSKRQMERDKFKSKVLREVGLDLFLWGQGTVKILDED